MQSGEDEDESGEDDDEESDSDEDDEQAEKTNLGKRKAAPKSQKPTRRKPEKKARREYSQWAHYIYCGIDIGTLSFRWRSESGGGVRGGDRPTHEGSTGELVAVTCLSCIAPSFLLLCYYLHHATVESACRKGAPFRSKQQKMWIAIVQIERWYSILSQWHRHYGVMTITLQTLEICITKQFTFIYLFVNEGGCSYCAFFCFSLRSSMSLRVMRVPRRASQCT